MRDGAGVAAPKDLVALNEHSAVDEADMVRRTALGDTGAFGQLVRAHQGRVRAYIGSYVRSPDVVDDLAQEVFLTAYASVGSFRGESAFSTWLLGIARHRVLGHLRTHLRKGRLVDRLIDGRRLDRVEDDAAHLDERERAIAALKRCVEILPPGSSVLVTEHYFQANTLADIGRRTQKGESAVRMTLLRIRRALRDCIERRLASSGIS